MRQHAQTILAHCSAEILLMATPASRTLSMRQRIENSYQTGENKFCTENSAGPKYYSCKNMASMQRPKAALLPPSALTFFLHNVFPALIFDHWTAFSQVPQ
jgi:hypothetical protein